MDPRGMLGYADPMRALLAILLLASPALADDEPGSARLGPAPAPDMVRLKNGGLVRGTISELVPNERVVIVTVAGEVKKIPMSEVSYAGPASSGVESHAKKLAMTANQPEVTFHRRISSAVTTGASVSVSGGTGGMGVGVAPFSATAASYAPLCVAPCEMALAPGTYYLGLSFEDGSPVSDNRPLVIKESTQRLVGEYTSYSALRTVGFTLGGLGLVGAMATTIGVLANDLPSCDRGACQISVEPLAIGVGIGVGAMIIGYFMSSKADGVSIIAAD